MSRLIILFFLFFSGLTSYGQIYLDNASFEGEPQDATMPNGWLECKEGTTPDILPGPWGVYTEASDGDTYVGLITRPDKSWESIGQRLSAPMEKGYCYSFNLDLAHSATYTGYNRPIKLRIWAGKYRCFREELVWESELIDHTDWKTYELFFYPKRNYSYIIFEAYFPQNRPTPYKGNVLIDNVTPIEKCDRA